MRSASDVLWIEQLALTQVPIGRWPNVHVLGSMANRITFADQQKRAFNLVAALVASKRVDASSSIAIVGGGVAGVTAAAYAVRLGLRPTLFEQYDSLMAIQHGSGRWIHPNLYDWPWTNWRTPRTQFPCMNWTAQAAGDVIIRLRSEWSALGAAHNIRTRLTTPVQKLELSAEARWIINEEKLEPFDAVVLAVGFGEEKAHPLFDSKPYWRDDDLHQRIRNSSKANVLVSGTGDGGLIDILRVLLRDFKYEDIVEFGQKAELALAAQIISIEVNRGRWPDGDALTDAYINLPVPPEIDDWLLDRVDKDLTVHLNGTETSPFDRQSSPLNRFITARLIKHGRIRFLSGAIDLTTIKSENGSFTVNVGTDALHFDHVAVRHGPVSTLARLEPEIAKGLLSAREFFRTYRDVADRTRQPLWTAILKQAEKIDPMTSNPSLPTTSVDGRGLQHLAEKLQICAKDALALVYPTKTPATARDTNQNGLRITISTTKTVGNIDIALASLTSATVECDSGLTGAAHLKTQARGPTPELFLEDLKRTLINIIFQTDLEP